MRLRRLPMSALLGVTLGHLHGNVTYSPHPTLSNNNSNSVVRTEEFLLLTYGQILFDLSLTLTERSNAKKDNGTSTVRMHCVDFTMDLLSLGIQKVYSPLPN